MLVQIIKANLTGQNPASSPKIGTHSDLLNSNPIPKILNYRFRSPVNANHLQLETRLGYDLSIINLRIDSQIYFF